MLRTKSPSSAALSGLEIASKGSTVPIEQEWTTLSNSLLSKVNSFYYYGDKWNSIAKDYINNLVFKGDLELTWAGGNEMSWRDKMVRNFREKDELGEGEDSLLKFPTGVRFGETEDEKRELVYLMKKALDYRRAFGE